MSNSSKQVLVLSSADSQANRTVNDEFVAAVNNQVGSDITVSWAHYNNIGYHFKDGVITAFWLKDGSKLPQYDFIYVKSYYRYTENALVLVEYFKQTNTPFVCSELENAISFSKLSQYARLTRAGLPIPETLYVPAVQLSHSFDNITNIVRLPFIMKAIDAKGGGANYLITSKDQYDSALADNHDVDFVFQVFIPNDSDLRVIVLGGKVDLIIKRQRLDNSTHLNNTSQGGGAVLVNPQDLSPQYHQLAIRTAQLMRREVAGVDLMFSSETGEPYVLEINASPQVATGAFVDEKIKSYSNFFKNMLQ